MSKKTVVEILIPVYIIGILLIIGCVSTSRPTYYGRTAFIPLKTSPEGAKVILDDSEKGFTPMTLKFLYLHDKRGSHNDETRERILKIEKEGYESYVLLFSIKGNEYKKIPSPIILKRLDNTVKEVESLNKDQQKAQELIEARKKAKETLKEIEKLRKENEKLGEEIAFLKEKNDTQEIKQYNETIADNQYANRIIYTVQTGSFINIERAQKQFKSIIQGLSGKELDYLRIEKVGRFYSVRLGKFENYATAEKFFQANKPQLPTAIILKAYIKDDRIIRLYKK